ncbi:MAG: glycosyltransferase [Muribaculaceae bacterium]
MMFPIDISQQQYILLGAALLATLVAMLVALVRVRRISRCASSQCGDAAINASIVVYSNDEWNSLEVILPQLLAQQTRADFEVIVVNEGESAQVQEIVSRLRLNHPNIYLTYTPDGARNLSRKKLAITLGVKAARYDVVVLTSALARIESDQWLQRIVNHFANPQIEVVLGAAVAKADDDQLFGARVRAFDHLDEQTAWLSAAIGGNPWRGTEHNLAYRRELFFRNKGFSRHLNLRYGDDDIFVSEIANSDNTAVELSPEGMVPVHGLCSPHYSGENWRLRRFTRRFIPHRPWVMSALARWCYGLAPWLIIASVLINLESRHCMIAAAVALLLWWAASLVWLPAVKVLHGRKLMLSLAPIMVGRPWRLLLRNITALFHRAKRYTWE